MEEDRKADRQMTGRFYTSARRFKQVLGSLPDGTKIPGGPYTYSQIGVMIGVIILGWLTRAVWSTGSAVGDLVILIVIAVGLGLIVARMPASRRSPLRLMGSIMVLLTHPGAGGRWKGKSLKLSRKAQRIQREQKNAAKAAARKPRGKTQTASTEPRSVEPQPAPAPVMPAGYGSSLNQLLAEHGLLEKTERKH